MSRMLLNGSENVQAFSFPANSPVNVKSNATYRKTVPLLQAPFFPTTTQLLPIEPKKESERERAKEKVENEWNSFPAS